MQVIINKRLFGAMLVLSGLCVASTASAAIFDRGGGLIYDDQTNLTWLQEAGLGGGSLYSQNDAQTLVENLEYLDSVRNVTWSDWRLPSVGTNPCDFCVPSDNELQVLWQHLGNTGQPPEAGNAGPFTGLVFAGYWNAEADWSTYLGNDGSWYDLGLPHGAWAVRTGDVAAVPVPGAFWLFSSAIAGIALGGRRKASDTVGRTNGD